MSRRILWGRAARAVLLDVHYLTATDLDAAVLELAEQDPTGPRNLRLRVGEHLIAIHVNTDDEVLVLWISRAP